MNDAIECGLLFRIGFDFDDKGKSRANEKWADPTGYYKELINKGAATNHVLTPPVSYVD